jgi:hypothetical protein
MTNRLLRLGMAILVGVLIVPGFAQARGHGRHHERGRDKVRVERHVRYYRPPQRHVAVYGDVRFNGYRRDYDDYDDDGGGYWGVYYSPYYLYHRRWEAWGGCGLPPGLAKKYGCDAYYRNGHYYRPNGTIISVTFATGR